MNSDKYADLSADEIAQRLNSLESDRAELEVALEKRRQQSKKELAAEIKELIVSRGYDIAEILDYIGARKRSTVRGKPGRSYIRYVDPKNPENVYVRGVLPKWMKDQMAEQGLNPKIKADREAFKEQYLNKSDR